MAGVRLCLSDSVELLCPDSAEYRAVAMSDRRGRLWADDYPTDGDVLMAALREGRTLHVDEPWGPLQIVDRGDGLVVGGIGFKGAPSDGSVEIGYGLAESARGRGLATESVRLLIEVASARGLSAVTARTDPGNVASQAVLLRARFRRDPAGDADGEWGWVCLLDA